MDAILRLDEIEAQHNVSRSVVREATRVLSSKGMLESRRRLGTVVQPAPDLVLEAPGHAITVKARSVDFEHAVIAIPGGLT